MRKLAIIVVLGIAEPALAADQFDLVCTAPKTEMRYRIDLARGEWCAGECKRVMKIAEVTSGMLTLHREEPQLPERRRAYTTIDRATGEWRWYYTDASTISAQDVNGTCEPAPFSGFPAAKF